MTMRRVERGYLFLLWSLALSAFAVVFITGYYPLFNRSIRVTQFSFEQARSRAAAEAGVEDALFELNQDTVDRTNLAAALFGKTCPAVPAACYVDTNGDNYIGVTPDISDQGKSWFSNLGQIGWRPCSNGTPNCFETAGSKTLATGAGDGSDETIGTYTVTLTGVGARLNTVPAPAHYVPSLGPPQPQLISTGSAAGRTTIIKAVLERTRSDFRYAAFGHEFVQALNKVRIDSYNSSAGAYGGTNVGLNGDIGTNGTHSLWPMISVNLTNGLTPPAVVNGRGYITTSTIVSIPESTELTGGPVTQLPHTLPHVQIPTSLTNIPTTTWATPPAGVSNDGNGNYDIPPGYTWTCTGAMRVRSITTWGVLALADGCELFVDNSTGTQTANFLYTGGSGEVRRTSTPGSTGSARVFLRDNGFIFDGRGPTWDPAIVEAERKPERFQIYQTCSGDGSSPCTTFKHSRLSPSQPFYGVVYVENGQLGLTHGNENPCCSDANYFGAFVSGVILNIDTAGSDKRATIHYDESLAGLPLDGTGRPAAPPGQNPRRLWKIKSWKMTQN